MKAHRLVAACVAAAGSLLLISSTALAAAPAPAPTAGANGNSGRVFLNDSDFENGDEPQFSCGETIYVRASKMDASSGSVTVDPWAPGGWPNESWGEHVYGYTYTMGGADPQTLVALSNLPAGHYRVTVTDNRGAGKHKMFWIRCATATPTPTPPAGPTPTPTPVATATPTPLPSSSPVATPTPTPTPTSTGGVSSNQGRPGSGTAGTGAAGAAGAAAAQAGTAAGAAEGEVQAATGEALAETGTPLGMLLLGLALVLCGAVVLRWRRRAID